VNGEQAIKINKGFKIKKHPKIKLKIYIQKKGKIKQTLFV
jgi:hypothetical protein